MTPAWNRALAFAAAAACALAPRPVTAQPQPPQPQSPPQLAPPASGRAFVGVSEDHILTEIHTARITARRQVGSTSVNFHLSLAADVDAGFKPRSASHGDAYRAEIAAFRLNRLLGL